MARGKWIRSPKSGTYLVIVLVYSKEALLIFDFADQ